MNAKNLELAGIKTVVIANEVAGQNGASQGLADVTPEMNAYVSCGNINELVELPPMKKIIGDIRAIANVSGGDEKSIRSDGSIVCEIQSIIGSTNELGCSKIGCEWI
jgi:glycine reductase